MTSISGSFAHSALGFSRIADGFSPKRFEGQFSPKASSERSIKDAFVPTGSVSVRNTYSLANKVLQHGKSHVPNPQAPDKNAGNPIADALHGTATYEPPKGGGVPSAENPTVPPPVVDDHNATATTAEPETEPMENNDATAPQTHSVYFVDEHGNKVFAESFTVADLIREWQANPGQLWMFEAENKAFEGHGILNTIFHKMYPSVTSSGPPMVDEYGYTFSVPGMKRVTKMIDGFPEFMGWFGGPFIEGQPTNAINSVERSEFGGLTLEERDRFFAEAQKIFDKYGVKLDASKATMAIMLPVCP